MLLLVLTDRLLPVYSTRPEQGKKKKELPQRSPVPAKPPRSGLTAELKILPGASELTCRRAGELPGHPVFPAQQNAHKGTTNLQQPLFSAVGPTHFSGRFPVGKGCWSISCGNRSLFSCLGAEAFQQ